MAAAPGESVVHSFGAMMKAQRSICGIDWYALLGGTAFGAAVAAIDVYLGNARPGGAMWLEAIFGGLGGAVLFGAVLLGLHPRSPFIRMSDWLAGSSTTFRLIMSIAVIVVCSIWIGDWLFYALLTMTLHHGAWVGPALFGAGPLAAGMITFRATFERHGT